MFKPYKLYVYMFMWLTRMPKREDKDTVRTTLIFDGKLWRRFLKFTFEKHGSAKKASFEAEAAIKEYLERHEREPRAIS